MPIAYFNRLSLELPRSCVIDCSQQGPVDELVKWWNRLDSPIRANLDAINPDAIRAELKEYGAWDETELADNDANRERLIWCAACQIKEESKGAI